MLVDGQKPADSAPLYVVAQELDVWAGKLWARMEQAPTWSYVLIVGLCIGFLLLLAPDFGSSWDVAYCERRAAAAHELYFNGFDGRKFLNTLSSNSVHYGPAVDVLIKLAQDYTTDGIRKIEIRTFLQALLTLSGLIPVFLISMRVVSKPLALIVVVLVASTPIFFGHAFINPKDGPFMGMFLWTLYLIVYCYADGHKPSYVSVTILGILLALTISLRSAALYLLGLIAVAAVLLPALQPQGRSIYDGLMERLWHQARVHFGGFSLLFLVTLAVYIVSIPALLIDIRPSFFLDTLDKFRHYPWKGHVLYFGKLIPGSELPRHYVYGYFLVQLPLYYHLFLASAAVWFLAMRQETVSRMFQTQNSTRLATSILLILALAIPLLLVFIDRPVLYDTVRHMLFIVPMLCMLLFFVFVEVVKGAPRAVQVMLCTVAVLCWAQSVISMVRLHPYEYVYYNPLVSPADALELDYWGTSFREVAENLNAYAAERNAKGLRVQVCGTKRLLSPFLKPGVFKLYDKKELARDGVVPDIIVALNRQSMKCMQEIEDKKPWLFTVEREGAILAAVARNSPNPEASASCPGGSCPSGAPRTGAAP